mmetsp:Transcript_5037/g.20662  ORF Transcript_5037/g.20662 Transcript_5037/m.20662 type:complete len:216 (-) Transcript_5037:852-1499(-)
MRGDARGKRVAVVGDPAAAAAAAGGEPRHHARPLRAPAARRGRVVRAHARRDRRPRTRARRVRDGHRARQHRRTAKVATRRAAALPDICRTRHLQLANRRIRDELHTLHAAGKLARSTMPLVATPRTHARGGVGDPSPSSWGFSDVFDDVDYDDHDADETTTPLEGDHDSDDGAVVEGRGGGRPPRSAPRIRPPRQESPSPASSTTSSPSSTPCR